ncbi:MAG: hypothetical protein HKN43_04570 [Rhodothermales bacterium]|nr:hypothetical protein [Rhodothermales bacterium]
MRLGITQLLALSLLFFVAACDSGPGTTPISTPAPVVSELSYSPSFFDLSLVLPADTVGGIVSVQIDAAVSVSDSDNNIDRVEVLLRSPLDGEPVILLEPLQSAGGGVYSISESVDFSIGALGLYTILVYAVDDAANISNQVRGLINFGASQPFGTAPVIQMIEALPDPAVPGQTLKMIATVSDAEGLSNILEVLIGTTNPPTDDFPMFDDGASSGDDVAGDGRYTASFSIPANQPPDTTTFYVQAFDRNGLASEVASREVRVQ